MAKTETVKQITSEGELQDVKLWFGDMIPKNGTWRYSGDITSDNTAKNMRIYPTPVKKIEDLSHIPEGLLDEGVLNLADNRMYTKLYIKQIPEFSKVTYLAYWHLICHHLSRDTNMIYNPKPRKHFIEKRIEFRQICKTSKNVTYKFLKECENRGYIAEFKLQGKRYFVANPVYTLNGNKIPIKLSNLFNIRIAQRNLIYQGEEE